VGGPQAVNKKGTINRAGRKTKYFIKKGIINKNQVENT
jgi:hypothetical protein